VHKRHSIAILIIAFLLQTDENRDINIHHIDEDIKRQRIQYNGDQIYPNVSQSCQLLQLAHANLKLSPQKIWSSKWCVKDEPKQQQQQQQQLTTDLTGSPVVSISTPPHNNNNNNSTNNSNTPNNASTANNGPSNNNPSYYDTHNVFPTSVNNNNNQDTILYDSITSISQAQNTLYAPSIGTAIGKFKVLPGTTFPSTTSISD
jgi:hypothetical protein